MTLPFGRQVKSSAIFKILRRKIILFLSLLRPLSQVHHSSASVLIACRRSLSIRIKKLGLSFIMRSTRRRC